MITAVKNCALSDVQSPTVIAIRSTDELRGFLPAWLEFLDGETTGHNMYNDPRAVLRHCEINETVQPLILAVCHNGAPVCIAPFYVQRCSFAFEFSIWRVCSLSARALRLFGESVVTSVNADLQECMSALTTFVKQNARICDYLHVYGLNYSDPFWRTAMRDGEMARRLGWKAVRMRPELIHEVSLKSTFEDFLASLGPSTRQTLRYSARRFFSDESARIDAFTQPADIPALIRCVEDVYPESWQAKAFGQTRSSIAEHQRQLEHAAEQGWLRSYVLFRDDAPVAYQLGYQYKRTYYLTECCYRRQNAAWSPGSVLSFKAFEHLHADHAVDAWNFGFGDMPYKRTFHGVAHDASVVYFVPFNRWRLILGTQTALNAAYDKVRNALCRLQIDKFVRRVVKRQK